MMRLPFLRASRVGLLLAAAALASACSILPEKEPVDTYALPGTLSQRAAGVYSAGISPALRVVRPVAGGAIAGKRIVVVEDTSQIELLDIPQAAGFCTVAEDGTVSYYKKEAAFES